MHGVEKLNAGTPLVRVAALAALVVLVAVSIRGYVPEASPIPRRQPVAGTWSVVLVFVMMVVSTTVAVIGLIALMRNPKAAPAPLPPLPDIEWRISGNRRRWMVIGALVVLAVAAAVVALSLGVGRNRAPNMASPPPLSQQADGTRPGRPAAEQSKPQPGADLFPLFAVSASVLAVTFVVGSFVVMRRSRSWDEQFAPGDEDPAKRAGSAADTLARAAELGLAEMADPSRDPRVAIIACYVAMERGLAEAPDAAPLESDTPTEVLARAVDHGVLHSDAAAGLVALFTEARFSPHRMTQDDRQSAVTLLGRVLADLRMQSWAESS